MRLDSFSSLYKVMASNAYISRYFQKTTVPKRVKFGFNPSPNNIFDFSVVTGAPPASDRERRPP